MNFAVFSRHGLESPQNLINTLITIHRKCTRQTNMLDSGVRIDANGYIVQDVGERGLN